jgi:BASS family bile acid:Na+ symporter
MPLWFSITIEASVILVVFAIGLETTWANAISLFRQPALLIKSLIARNLAMPLVAILLAKAFPMHPAVKGAVVLLSVTPIPPVLPNALLKAGARASYVCGLLVSHSVLAIMLVPLTVEVMNLIFGTQAHFGLLAVTKEIALAILLPLGAGMALRHILEASAPRLARTIGMVGTILLLASIFPLAVVAWRALQVVIGNGALVALALFVIAGLAAGHALGGPKESDRTALAMATASRHPGLAIAIAAANFPNQAQLGAGAVMIYLLFSQILFIPYRRWRHSASDDDRDGTTIPAHT